MVTNGTFNTSASWTFDAPGGTATGQTSAYDGTISHTVGSGSGKAYVPTNNRGKTVIGVIRQTVSIPAGSTVSAASLWAVLSANQNTGDSVTIDLRYADLTTVNLLNTGELTLTVWTQFTAAPALTLVQNVDQIIVTLNAKTANNTTNDVGLWVDDISVTYTVPAIDALSVGSNTAGATAAAPLATDVQMQVLQVGSSNTGNGNCVITSVTVNDVGTVVAGDIANLRIHIDSDNNFGNGVLGTVTQAGWAGTSTVVDLSSIAAATRTVTNPTAKYIWITYDLAASADTKTIQSQVTAVGVLSPDTGASGTWNSNLITVSSGPSNTLATCADCHDMPPVDSADAVRNAPTPGEVRGDHVKHNAYTCSVCHNVPATETSADFGHRDGNISVKSGSIGVTDNGTYSRGPSFAQSNTPTTGTCSVVNCHANAITPQWGVGTTTCSSCHALPPLTNAHSKHYTEKGWATGSAANCTVCHPDNSTAHSSVTDGVIQIIASLSPGGTSPAITCSATPAGCHNGKPAPAWNTTGIACTGCHTVGGAGSNPTSGLHNVVPSITGAQHDDSFGTGGTCTSCHTTLAAQTTHANGTFTGNGSVAGDRTAMGLFAAFTTSGADNSGTCAGTGTSCHGSTTASQNYRDDWAHQWNSTASYYTTNTTACGGCHGDFGNGWNTGVIHRTSAATQSNHGGTGTYDCKDCHTLEAAAGNYTFTFGTLDWTPLNATSEHGNSNIEVNNNGITYNATSGLCAPCHGSSDGVHNFLDTSWAIAALAGDAPSITCGQCHTGGVKTSVASGAHTMHNSGTAALVDGGAACVECHGNNTGLGYHNSLAGTHGSGSVTFANVTYSTAVRNNVTGTCLTANCHNLNTKADQSTAWNTTALACDDCHYYALAPTSAGNTAHARPLSASHGDHFASGKTCAQCHGADPAAGDTTHIGGVTTLADKAVALQDEAAMDWTAAATDYVFDDGGNTCYTATNSGLGCHATAGAAGIADVTRPDWDVAFDGATACTNCHTNTSTAAVNPTSGLHSVVPSVTGQQHNQSVTGGCVACHTALTAQTTHARGTFTGNGSVAGDRTAMGLFAAFTTSGTDNSGTCAGTGTSCHGSTTAANNYRDDWAHQWNSTASYYTTNGTACGGCHGDWVRGWNTGVIHRTSSGTQGNHGDGGTNYECKECHTLEDSANVYTFTWSTNDWGGTSKHGNNIIEINNAVGTSYNATTGLCSSSCHATSDDVHNFLNTSWTTAWLVGSAAPSGVGHASGANCKGCHAATQGARRNVSGEFPATLQHGAAWATMTNADCEKCHAETSGPDSTVQLKVWNADGTTFTTANYDKTNLSTANTHCIACHDTTRNVTIAGLNPPARSMVNYTSATTYNNHNFSAAATWGTAVVPQKAKAISAHGNPSGNQLKNGTDTMTTALGCLHCHPSHGSAVASKTTTDANNAAVAARMLGGNPSALTAVGLDYTGEGTFSDPSICWKCHASPSVKVADYYGDTITGNWNVGGVWKSPSFSYKTGKGGVLSVHVAVKGGASSDAAASIVCTSCHDVHGSPTVAQFYSPMLKGKWLTSPYFEDRAPPAYAAGTNGLFNWPNANAAPRGGNSGYSPRAEPSNGATTWVPKEVGGGYGTVGTQNGAWGYFIDANTFGMSSWATESAGALPTQQYFYNRDSTNFTSTGITNFAGLCMGCHTQATIDSATTNWSGHRATVPGFGGTTTVRDLFNITPAANQLANGRDQIGKHYYANGDYGQNLFAQTARQGGNSGALDARTYSHNKSVSWGVTVASTTATTQTNYHQFPCSKCHTPHASVLPTLMRSNCLDVKQSGYEYRMADEAANCHRVEQATPTLGVDALGGADTYNGTTNGQRWNTVTPW